MCPMPFFFNDKLTLDNLISLKAKHHMFSLLQDIMLTFPQSKLVQVHMLRVSISDAKFLHIAILLKSYSIFWVLNNHYYFESTRQEIVFKIFLMNIMAYFWEKI